MTILARILCFVGIVVLVYMIFFWKPREILIEQPVRQAQPQVSTPQPPSPRPRPQPKPRPGQQPAVTFEPDQPIFRSLQPTPVPAQTAINRRIEEIRLNAGDGSPEERSAIRNAQLGLNLLKESSGQSRR